MQASKIILISKLAAIVQIMDNLIPLYGYIVWFQFLEEIFCVKKAAQWTE